VTSARVHRFANGVRIVCDPMAGLESLALSVVIRGGARWEDGDHNGWSHLLEHMVFKGAGGRSARDIVEAIEQHGGHINAATGYERTSFQVRCLKGGLPLAMDVLSGLVRYPTLNSDDLEREKSVIGQEIAEAADTPDDRVFDLAQAHAYAGQALGRPILGEPTTIGGATAATLGAYHRALYASDRIVVSAAGAVDEDELLALAEAAFGDATTPDRASACGVEAPKDGVFGDGSWAETRKLEQAHLVILMPGVGARDPDYFAARLFAEALGGGMSSRLFQEAREVRGLVYGIDAYCESYEDCGVFGVYAGTAAADAAETARVTAQQIRALADSVTATELARAKAQLKASLFMARESPLSRAEQAAGQLFLFDRLFTPAELAGAIDDVDITDFQRMGRRLAADPRAAIAVLGPRKAAEAAEAFRGALAA
jgi:predicted Zn-dependent peptidase